MRDVVLLQQGLDHHTTSALTSALGCIRIEGHALECQFADLGVDHENEVDLQRAIARGVALRLLEYAEGRVPMGEIPIYSSTPKTLLEGWR